MPIKDHEEYEVSSSGEVRRLAGTPFCPNGRILKASGHETSVGYDQVNLYRKGIKSRLYVHVLVASAFIGKRPDWKKIQINHKDGDRGNNHVGNLEYVTVRQNSQHAVSVLGHKRGIKNGNAKLTEDQVREIRGMKLGDAAKKFCIHVQTAFRIRHGLLWGHVE